MNFQKTMLSVFAAVSAVACAAGTVEEAFAPYDKATDIPGAVSAEVTFPDEPRFACTGYADIKAKRPMTPDSLFWIASNTKGVAAALLLTFVDEGKISLSDPVEKYLPEFARIRVADKSAPGGSRPPKTKPTIRQILSHTSGLPFFPKMPIDQWPMRLLASIAADTPLAHAPGAKYCYSNWGIDVAMAVVEVVGRKPWDVLLQERILGPLGMKDTTFFPSDEQMSRLALPYTLKPGSPAKAGVVDQFQYPYSLHTRYPEAGGGLFSTPRDMIKFFGMVAARGTGPDGKRILSESAIDEWLKKQTPDNIKNSYSFGMNTNGKSLSHGGAYATYGESDVASGSARLYFVQLCGGNERTRARRAAWGRATVTPSPERAKAPTR